VISVGDLVSFEDKKARVVSVKGDNCNIYIIDATGGYNKLVPLSSISLLKEQDGLGEDIKKPVRYNKRGKLECWDVILDQQMNFLEGSVIKYLWRYKEKNGIQDLEKAKVYIDKIISELKK
jgi:hypothetical protein